MGTKGSNGHWRGQRLPSNWLESLPASPAPISGTQRPWGGTSGLASWRTQKTPPYRRLSEDHLFYKVTCLLRVPTESYFSNSCRLRKRRPPHPVATAWKLRTNNEQKLLCARILVSLSLPPSHVAAHQARILLFPPCPRKQTLAFLLRLLHSKNFV